MSRSKHLNVQKNLSFFDWKHQQRKQNIRSGNQKFIVGSKHKEEEAREYNYPNYENLPTYCLDPTIVHSIKELKPSFLTFLLAFGMLFETVNAKENSNSAHSDDLNTVDGYSNPNTFVTTSTMSINAKLDERLIVSENAKEEYLQNPSLCLEKDIEKVKKDILNNINSTNNLAAKKANCKLNSVFEDPKFKIELCSFKEIQSTVSPESQGSILAHYDRHNNKIRLPSSGIYKGTFISEFTHELHHAWVNRQNRNLFFYDFATLEKDPSSIPCKPIEVMPGKINCTEILTIHDNAMKKINDVFSYIKKLETNNKNSGLTEDQLNLVKEYNEASKGYQPLLIDMTIDKSVIESLQKEKKIDAQFKIKERSVISLMYGDWRRYAYGQIKYHDQKYIVKTRSHWSLSTTPFYDYKFVVDTYNFEGIDVGNIIKERDAIIHQVFENYPKLYNFFFKELEEYHFQRSDANYQACMTLTPMPTP